MSGGAIPPDIAGLCAARLFRQEQENLRRQEEMNARLEEANAMLSESKEAVEQAFQIAEDNEINAEILSELLDMAGASCDICENGQAVVGQTVRTVLEGDPT